ncbi:hypothetical protein [Spirosoma agri]|uniref:hypothetical protein n=1 Tax=Spirosoma agri TaxID=1987381 RepID=UPI0014783395|nr:hypothetical protein [Spirosoma agri]
MKTHNPFLELEPDAECPPHLKAELIAEIDLIRDVATVLELYIGDLFGVVSVLASPPR